jgi:CubicO group peptidase (beta-lactamase class C family)
VIEQVSGAPYERYIYEEITGPLGLDNTRFELDSDQAGLKATGYSHPTPGGSADNTTRALREATYAPLRGIAAAGQLHSNVQDLAKWISFQFTAGRKTHQGKVLSASTLAEMHRPVYVSDDWKTGQAIGWRLSRRGDLVLHNHGGGIQGFSSNIVFNVKAQTGAIVLANIWPAPTPYVLAEDIAELVIGELGPVDDPRESDLVEVSPDQAARYLGRYWAEPGAFADVVYDDSGFGLGAPRKGDYTLHGPAVLKTDPAVDDQYVFRVEGGRGAGELAEFSVTDAGSVESFRLGGFLYRRVE